jgi:hypothetical protein
MLSAFLNQIQSYFSKYFLIGSFLPVLAFAFLNGLIAYVAFGEWQAWADKNLLGATVTGGAFLIASFGVAVLIAAYVLSSLSTFLRRCLEGKWGPGVSRLFMPAQNRRRERLIQQMNEAAMEMADLENVSLWQSEIRKAQEEGRRSHPGKPYVTPNPDKLAHHLDRLEVTRRNYGVIVAKDLEELVEEITSRFRECDVDESEGLEAQNRRLGRLIEYSTETFAAQSASARYARLQNEFNSNFGAQDLAPTKMGNVANTIQSYALRRYHCNIELVWSNLQWVVQKDANAFASLQEAKTQLDFLIACCWLTLLSAIAWAIIFAWIEPSRVGFLAAALGGPLFAYMWYRAAAEQYRSFADVAMTSFDTFRFDLLKAMRLSIPADVEEERLIWANVDTLTAAGEERNFRYVPGS